MKNKQTKVITTVAIILAVAVSGFLIFKHFNHKQEINKKELTKNIL